MKRSFPWILTIACATFLFLTISETRAVTIPADAAHQPKVLWRMVMEGFYGPYDKRHKCWISHMGGETVCMRPHRLDQVSVQGVDHYFIVIGGTRLDDSGQPLESHADAGVLGLMIFKADGRVLKLVAKNDLHASMGSFGSIPAEDQFSVREIGPNDTYGWVANNGWMGQGIVISYSDVFAAVGDTVVDIGSLPAHYDNSGNCEDGKVIGSSAPCSDYSSTIMFDSGQQGDRFYPVILKVAGSREGVPIDRTYTAKFDPNKLTYSKMEGLPKEFADGI